MCNMQTLKVLNLTSISVPPIESNCLRVVGLHSLQLHISPFEFSIRFLKIEEVFDCFMSCDRAATVYFQGRLESLLQKTWSEPLGVRMHFQIVMAAGKIGAFPAIFSSFRH